MNKIVKISGVLLAGVLLFQMNSAQCSAETIDGEQPVAGITLGIDHYYENLDKNEGKVNTLSLLKVPVNIPKNLGIAKVDNYLNIRKAPGTNEKIVGKLPKNAGCTVLDVEGDWAHIKSGKVSGYVSTDYLVTGKKADKLAEKVGSVKITVQESGLFVRTDASTEASILDQLAEGEQFDVTEELVVNKKDPNATAWVKIDLDNEEAYVARDYVSLSYELNKAVPITDVTGVSSSRMNLLSTAKKYLGLRYVWGGTSLTYGADCSGFVQQIFRQYGYSLPRTSRSQACVGTQISSRDAKAGDLVFYGNGGGINHVAICIGNGQIIHASNPRDGVKISNMYYRTPARVVRIINS